MDYKTNGKKLTNHTKKLVIVFRLFDPSHRRVSIAECNNIISKIESNTPFEEIDSYFREVDARCLEMGNLSIKNNVIVNNVEQQIKKSNLQKFTKEIWDNLQKYTEIIYLFRAFITNENYDSFDSECLCPFSLIQQKYTKKWIKESRTKKIILEILGEEEKEYYRISHFLFLESLFNLTFWDVYKARSNIRNIGKLKLRISRENDDIDTNDYYNQCFFYREDEGEWKADRLQVNGIGSFHEFIPILRLNKYSYSILSKNVNECFEDFDHFINDKTNIIDELDNNLRLKKIKRNITLSQENKKRYQEILVETLIKRTCKALLIDSGLLKENILVNDLFGLCSHMSILSFLFFVTFCSKTKNNLLEHEVVSLVHSCQDYADGIQQIIENAVEYAQETAYFRFRIKQLDVDKTEIKKPVENVPSPFYLEVIISDFSQSDIPEKFLENIHSRTIDGDNPFNSEWNLELKDFFKPDEEVRKKWNAYYERIENITYHYGLQQFLNSVAVGNGFFKVVSSQNIDPSDHEIYEGDFSKNHLLSLNTKKKYYIPGTEYIIRLPIEVSEMDFRQIPVGIGIELNYDDEIINQPKCFISLSELVYGTGVIEGHFSQVERENRIIAMKTEINKLMVDFMKNGGMDQNKSCTICFDAKHVNGVTIDKQYIVDIFTKSLIQYLNQDDKLVSQRIAVINASRTFILNFTRAYATFCFNIESIDRIRKKLENVQIYICDKELDTEIVFYGIALSAAYKCCEYMAGRKGVYPETENILREVLLRKNKTAIEEDKRKKTTYKIAPFDISLTIDKNSPTTLFEKRTEIELSRNIQGRSLGCSLHNSHMRVGSKVHIKDKFFDATLLLASSYYTKRFSYILAKKINKLVSENTNQAITIIGYEDYSELLIVEIQKRLISEFKYENVKFAIYEQHTRPFFKYENCIEKMRNYFIVVPVNTTLTTHKKISAALQSLLLEKGADLESISINNFAVILIRDNENFQVNEISEIEKRFWEKIDLDSRTVKTSFLSQANYTPPHFQDIVSFNILLASDWENPLTCEGCFPKKSFIDEMPMLEVSKSSVMLMTMAGLKEKLLANKSEIANTPGEIEDLKDVLLYGHISHIGDHYQYFFQTEKLMQNLYKNKPGKYKKWKDEIKRKIDEQRNIREIENTIVYDIVVAPIHSTNAVFIEDINSSIFDSAPIVLYIDSAREFRDSIKAKFSNITSLYLNNLYSRKKAEINFHYVDTSITSGETLRRTQSLIRSLFPTDALEGRELVKINLFKNIIILVNRCSIEEITDYISCDKFYTYYNVQISPIRTHLDDECILCNLKKQYESIISCCSTNEMASWWLKKINKIRLRTVKEEVEKDKSPEKLERSYRRLVCAHTFSKSLSQISNIEKNDPQIIRKIILDLIKYQIENTNENESLEYLISYIKVISRPFISLRKSTLEAIYKVLIEITEIFISVFNEDQVNLMCNQDIEFLKNYFDNIKIKCPLQNSQLELFIKRDFDIKIVHSLFKCLLSQLASLGSKYLIRKTNLQRIISCANVIGILPNNFKNFYLEKIKRVITVNRDETIGLWLEYLLCTGCEYQGLEEDNEASESLISLDFQDNKNDFYKILFMENTHIVFDAIDEIYNKLDKTSVDGDEIDNVIRKHIGDYYFENFRVLRHFQKYFLEKGLGNVQIKPFDPNTIMNFDEHFFSEIKNLIQLRILLKNNENVLSISDYYDNLAKFIKRVVKSSNISIYGRATTGAHDKTYLISSTDVDKPYDIKIREIIEYQESKKSNYDTFIFDQEKFSLIRIINHELPDTSDRIYLAIHWGEKTTELEKLFSIRDLLTFRHEMMVRFQKDFNNDAFQNFRYADLTMQKIVSIKAVTHTIDDIRINVCKMIQRSIESSDGKQLREDEYYQKQAMLLQITADSLISELYVRSTQKIMIEGYTKPANQVIFSNELVKTLESIEWDKDTDEVGHVCSLKLNILHTDSEPLKFTSLSFKGHEHYPLLFIVTLLQNAAKHGSTLKGNLHTVEVTLRPFNDYLEISNLARLQTLENLENENSHISIKAIKYYYENYTDNDLVNRGLEFCHSGSNFTVRLPRIYSRSKGG